ncbi:hypothetical protein LU290_02535 [Moraxella nasibovis]|uniref:hypothetical protein n=1 Tax=Moraxella nasibovis TaxID=2904120 RepID=UPI00240EFDFF|nr:hypothetical protein [Moraxella nasibovis]WFF39125.1 hypothetical protein LU290_02535 [Moraxella nasibovis]
MNIDLILSKIPSQNQLSQIFKNFGFKTCVFLQENDWESLENDSSEIIVNFSKILDKKWLCHLDIFIDKHIENEKLFYFQISKQIALIIPCDVICCYYDNEIINSPISNNPFYDFAYIDNHWYLIDDANADYANDELKGGDIKIIKSIDKEMEYFLLNKCYLKTNSKIDTPFIQP